MSGLHIAFLKLMKNLTIYPLTKLVQVVCFGLITTFTVHSFGQNSLQENLALTTQVLDQTLFSPRLFKERAPEVIKIGLLQLIKQKNIRPDQILDMAEARTATFEKTVLLFLAHKVNNNTLEPFLNQLLEKFIARSSKSDPQDRISKIDETQRKLLITILADAIKSTVRLRGLTADSKIKHMEWVDYSKMVSKAVRNMPGKTFEEKLINASEGKVTRAKEIRLLVDGKESFPLREKLMAQATKSIDIMSWAIYDDQTGISAVDTLMQKHQQGLRVRVIVDGQISLRDGYGSEVKRLETSGVPVIRWNNPQRKFEGQHRKLMVIDEEHAITGGLNFGDVYSHKNPASAQWRDTDLYFRGGSAATEAQNLFTTVWNSQVDAQALKLKKTSLLTEQKNTTTDNDSRLVIIDSRPSQNKNGSPIIKTILTAIRNAQSSVDIENAYTVLFPAVKEELTQAVARGVSVRVFTNSTKSVDEPVISLPIIRSARELAKKGVQIFLKHGDTLHSKMLVVDRTISMIKTYNLHPRSERIEEEMAVLVLDKKFSEHVAQTFEQDIKEYSDAIQSAEQMQLPYDPASLLSLRIFFDQL